MLAQVQIETTRQQKETAVINAEIQVVKAKAEADARRQQFTAEADGIRLRGEAEAAAIRAKAEALAANTNLVGLNAVENGMACCPPRRCRARRCPSSASSNRAVGGLAPPGVVHQPGAGQRRAEVPALHDDFGARFERRNLSISTPSTTICRFSASQNRSRPLATSAPRSLLCACTKLRSILTASMRNWCR